MGVKIEIKANITPTRDCQGFDWWVACDPNFKDEGTAPTYTGAKDRVTASAERMKSAIAAAWPMKDVVLFTYEAPDDDPPPVGPAV